MIEKIFIISFLVFAIWYSMKPGEIFSGLAKWLDFRISKKLMQPIADCHVCMCPWHGTYLYWLIWGLWLKTAEWQEWLIVVIAAMGVNGILSHLFPKEPPEEYLSSDESPQGEG